MQQLVSEKRNILQIMYINTGKAVLKVFGVFFLYVPCLCEFVSVLTQGLSSMHSAITGEPNNEEQIKADSVQGAAAPKQISTIIQPCSLQRDSITENKASVYVSGLV